METLQFRAMNTDIVIAAEGTPDDLKTGFEKARQFVLDSEKRFTRFSQDSELSQLNNSGGAWFHASPGLLTLVMLAQGYVEQTRGLFDPSILPDLRRAGYDRSMDLIRSEGVFTLPEPSAQKRTPFDSIVIRPQESLISLPAGLSLDLGGIAKGWIAEQAAHVLSEYSDACGVSAGGDMFLIGLPFGQKYWDVGLDDPRKSEETLAVLRVPPGGLATSAVTKRVWKQGEKARHHLIDPRSGEPAETEWLSVTVIAEHADKCEVFAKALLIAGPKEAVEIADNAGIVFLAVDKQGAIIGTQKSLEYTL